MIYKPEDDDTKRKKLMFLVHNKADKHFHAPVKTYEEALKLAKMDVSSIHLNTGEVTIWKLVAMVEKAIPINITVIKE